MSRPVNKIIAPAILVFCMSLSTACAQALPDAEDVSVQAEAAGQTLEEFIRESIQPRLAYEYKQCFFSEKDRVELAELSRQASADLKKIYDAQEELRRRIEDYEGHGWDELYGQTGLWRRVRADVAKTLLFKGRVDYFVALTAGPKKKERIVQDIISMCESARLGFAGASGEILKARALVLMARDNESYEEQAESTLDSILAGRDLADEVYFRAAMLKTKLAKEVGKKQLDGLVGRMKQSACRDDFELNLRLGFLALHLGRVDLLEKVIEKWPEAEDFVGSVILSEMDYQCSAGRLAEQALRQKSVFEVTLAVKAAIVRGSGKYKELLNKLCYELDKFRSSLLYYALARAHLEDDPARAVEYYAGAAKLKTPVGDSLDIEKSELAKKAATLAYKLYYENSKYCELATEAGRRYCDIAGSDADEEIQYLWAVLQNECGDVTEAAARLQKIARGTGRFSKQAELDLIVHGLEDSSNDSELRYKLTSRLKNLLDSVAGTGTRDGMVRAEAAQLYCQLILENDDEASARKVLTMLEGGKGLDIPRSCILKAVALKKIGRFWSAVNELLKAAKFDNCEYGAEGLDILRTILDNRIDEHKYYMADFMFYIDACDQLAEYCLACAQPQWQAQASLIRAEIAILCPRKSLVGDGKNENLDKAEQILTKLSSRDYDNDIDWLRCKARLLMAKGEFLAAFRAWGRVRAANKTESEKQSRQWWRAKFYEIQCWAKLPDTTKADVAHAVEVLAGSFRDIPIFWAAKLEELKARANQ